MAEPRLRLLRAWKATWRLSWRERWLLVQSLWLLPSLGLALRLFGFRRLYGTLLRLTPEPHPPTFHREADLSYARATASVVQSAAWYSTGDEAVFCTSRRSSCA